MRTPRLPRFHSRRGLFLEYPSEGHSWYSVSETARLSIRDITSNAGSSLWRPSVTKSFTYSIEAAQCASETPIANSSSGYSTGYRNLLLRCTRVGASHRISGSSWAIWFHPRPCLGLDNRFLGLRWRWVVRDPFSHKFDTWYRVFYPWARYLGIVSPLARYLLERHHGAGHEELVQASPFTIVASWSIP